LNRDVTDLGFTGILLFLLLVP